MDNELAEWREDVRKQAAEHGLETECLEAFDQYIKEGKPPAAAHWAALYDWDI